MEGVVVEVVEEVEVVKGWYSRSGTSGVGAGADGAGEVNDDAAR